MTTEQQKPTTKPPAERTPIPIDKLIFTNIAGIKLPDGPEGKNERIMPNLTAGIHGEVKTEIEHRPWLRVFHVTKSKRVTRTGGKDGKEIVSWEPMGKAFRIPDTCAVSVPAED